MINLVTIKTRRNYLVSAPNYHSKKHFWKHLLAIVIKRTQILINKMVYLGLSILKMSKTVIFGMIK